MGAVACGDAFEPVPELLGTWNATSITAPGVDFVDDGMTLRMTFSDDGSYAYTVTGDQLDFCDAGPDCSDSGDYVATTSQITLDPGSDWEETYAYTISSGSMTMTIMWGGTTFTFTFQRQ
jgi:hypothetical protein